MVGAVTSVYVRGGGGGGGGGGMRAGVCVCVCVCARAFLAVIELLLGSVLKVGFYFIK